jgi:AraC-like DNA-binding protein
LEWINKVNDAIDYIEENIAGKIDYTKAASAACCSLSRFQYMFLFITDITPSEYVRRRRMSLSAYELLESKIKIIHLSHKYGYESPEAFTRSFKAFHGISPSYVRTFGKFNEYPRISFKLQIQGGHFKMGTSTQFEVYKDILIKMEIIELLETLKFAGLTNPGPMHFECIGVYHEKYKALMAGRHTPYTEIGIASDIFRNEGWYAFGCQVDSTDSLPEDLVAVDTGLTKFAVCTFRVQPGGDLVGGEDGPGFGMEMASDYLKNIWMPKNKDSVYGYGFKEGGHTHHFEVKKGEKPYKIINISSEGQESSFKILGWPEVYHVNINEEPEMCYYIPLK